MDYSEYEGVSNVYQGRSVTRGHYGFILRNTHDASRNTYYVGIKEYIMLYHMDPDILPIRFNDNYCLDEEFRTIPLVKVPIDIFKRCQKIRSLTYYDDNEKIVGTKGIILPPTNAKKVKYFVPVGYYINITQSYPGFLPAVRFNGNYSLISNGKELTLVKVPYDIFCYVKEHKIKSLYL